MKLRVLSILVMASLTQACSMVPYEVEVKRVNETIEQTIERGKQLNSERPAFQVHQGYYLGSGDSVTIPSNELLPPVFSKSIVISSRAITLKEAVSVITEQYGIQVNIQDDASMESSEEVEGDNPMVNEVIDKRESINYIGDVAGLADNLAALFDLSWRYKNGRIEFYSWETQSFMLALPSEKVNSIVTFENVGANGVKDHVIVAESEADNIEELSGTIDDMLSENGRSSYSSSSGMITVTDTPTVISQVADLVDTYNKVMMRQVSIEVNVYNVTTDKLSGGGVDLSLAFTGSSTLGAGTLSPASVLPAAGIGGASAVLLSGSFANSSFVANALNNVGKVALSTTGSGVILNNQTMPIQNTKTTGYLKSISTTSTVNAGVETELESDTVDTGFAMTVTPRIMNDKSVILSYGMSLSSLDSLKPVSTNGQSIQTPEISAMKTMQRVSVKSGNTLVLTGFSSDRVATDESTGVTGSSKSGAQEKTVTVVAITVNEVNGAQ
jgi:type IVB pilus formation R64 PilN family outer membrane protein